MGRTYASVLSKMQKLRAKVALEHEAQVRRNMENGIKCESKRPSGRAEASIESLLVETIRSFPGQGASKEDILRKFATDNGYLGQIEDETWKRQVENCLYNSRMIQKVKGTFALNSRRDYASLISQNPGTLKTRLIEILLETMERRASLDYIVETYMRKYMSRDLENEEVWKETRLKIQKALSNYNEIFDRSQSKTTYMVSS
eukprot:TRINITY_DN8024_c0_g3_i4.p1 TRINITY_DN8024_c0_g3~~TRINITY_DN8024_c0_g3_i4.p1  ORF type:complete len:202 (+),score=34.43 TRINITY_DN8024_c0_g3_i4:244-849(+)